MKLFDKVRMGHSCKESKNRIALAPMTNAQSNWDGTLGEDEFYWLIRRAEGGFGIIITCAANVSADGKGWEGELGNYDDRQISGLKRLAERIHDFEALAIIQIFHGGARSPVKLTGVQPWSASEYVVTGDSLKIIREAKQEDIERVIEHFTSAAVRASEAGWDGVELHSAHGYLLHQFLSTETNKRRDKWGGIFENRYRLLQTVLKKIREETPLNFIIGVRLSPEDHGNFKGIDFDESLLTASMLADEGADYIHVSAWDALKKPDKYMHRSKNLITYYRELLPVSIPLMVAGELWTPPDVEKAFSLGADFVALGRAAIGNPDWPKLAKKAYFIPERPPYTVDYLNSVKVSDRFTEYLMKGWKDFVKEPQKTFSK